MSELLAGLAIGLLLSVASFAPNGGGYQPRARKPGQPASKPPHGGSAVRQPMREFTVFAGLSCDLMLGYLVAPDGRAAIAQAERQFGRGCVVRAGRFYLP